MARITYEYYVNTNYPIEHIGDVDINNARLGDLKYHPETNQLFELIDDGDVWDWHEKTDFIIKRKATIHVT